MLGSIQPRLKARLRKNTAPNSRAAPPTSASARPAKRSSISRKSMDRSLGLGSMAAGGRRTWALATVCGATGGSGSRDADAVALACDTSSTRASAASRRSLSVGAGSVSASDARTAASRSSTRVWSSSTRLRRELSAVPAVESMSSPSSACLSSPGAMETRATARTSCSPEAPTSGRSPTTWRAMPRPTICDAARLARNRGSAPPICSARGSRKLVVSNSRMSSAASGSEAAARIRLIITRREVWSSRAATISSAARSPMVPGPGAMSRSTTSVGASGSSSDSMKSCCLLPK